MTDAQTERVTDRNGKADEEESMGERTTLRSDRSDETQKTESGLER
jgi:hypothetical protein